MRYLLEKRIVVKAFLHHDSDVNNSISPLLFASEYFHNILRYVRIVDSEVLKLRKVHFHQFLYVFVCNWV